MTNINTGGAAFPCEGGSDSGLFADPGMSLRDYIAAKALQGLLAADQECGFKPDVAAEYAYRFADAMLAAREVQP